ncbi:MAG: DUF1476 domain-containing protein [Pseudomonadota bacterium]
MASLDDRKKGFESKYKNDAELAFKITARRNHLLGAWLAGEMGLSGDKAESLAKAMVRSDLDEPGDEDVIRFAMAQIAESKLEISAYLLRRKLEQFQEEAKSQIIGEG